MVEDFLSVVVTDAVTKLLRDECIKGLSIPGPNQGDRSQKLSQ